MSMQSRKLRAELCFRPAPLPEQWLKVLHLVCEWEPRIVPRTVERLSDRDWKGQREPWTDAHWEQLAQRCAAETPTAWSLFGDHAALLVAREPLYVKLSVVVKPPTVVVPL